MCQQLFNISQHEKTKQIKVLYSIITFIRPIWFHSGLIVLIWISRMRWRWRHHRMIPN